MGFFYRKGTALSVDKISKNKLLFRMNLRRDFRKSFTKMRKAENTHSIESDRACNIINRNYSH